MVDHLPPDAAGVCAYLPAHLVPLLGRGVDELRPYLLPDVFAIGSGATTRWIETSRDRLLADPVVVAGYTERASLSQVGMRAPATAGAPAPTTLAATAAGAASGRPAASTSAPAWNASDLEAGGARAAARGGRTVVMRYAAAGDGRRRLIDTALCRVLFPRKAKRPARVTLPTRNWDFVRGLEERVRLVECALSDAIPLQNPVPLKWFPAYLDVLGPNRKPVCLLDLYKAVTLTSSEVRWRGAGAGAWAKMKPKMNGEGPSSTGDRVVGRRNKPPPPLLCTHAAALRAPPSLPAPLPATVRRSGRSCGRPSTRST